MRCIDADALLLEFDEQEPDEWFESERDLWLDMRLTAIHAPTIEAEPVRYGEWKTKHNPITDPKGYFIRIVCSECNLHTGQRSNYCPQCGAKMDGKE